MNQNSKQIQRNEKDKANQVAKTKKGRCSKGNNKGNYNSKDWIT